MTCEAVVQTVDHEDARLQVVEPIVELQPNIEETPAEGLTYQRADGTVERAADIQDAIKLCPVLGKMALQSPEMAEKLARLSAMGSKKLAEQAEAKAAQPPKEAEVKVSQPEAEAKSIEIKPDHLEVVSEPQPVETEVTNVHDEAQLQDLLTETADESPEVQNSVITIDEDIIVHYHNSETNEAPVVIADESIPAVASKLDSYRPQTSVKRPVNSENVSTEPDTFISTESVVSISDETPVQRIEQSVLIDDDQDSLLSSESAVEDLVSAETTIADFISEPVNAQLDEARADFAELPESSIEAAQPKAIEEIQLAGVEQPAAQTFADIMGYISAIEVSETISVESIEQVRELVGNLSTCVAELEASDTVLPPEAVALVTELFKALGLEVPKQFVDQLRLQDVQLPLAELIAEFTLQLHELDCQEVRNQTVSQTVADLIDHQYFGRLLLNLIAKRSLTLAT